MVQVIKNQTGGTHEKASHESNSPRRPGWHWLPDLQEVLLQGQVRL